VLGLGTFYFALTGANRREHPVSAFALDRYDMAMWAAELQILAKSLKTTGFGL
jgi:hypothetical protein